MSDTKRKVQEALAEKRRLLQNIKDSKKNQAAMAPPETTAPSTKEDLDTFLKDINTMIPTSTPTTTTTSSPTPLASSGSLANSSSEIKSQAPTRRQFNLSIQANVIQIDIPPKEIPTYTKGTQTDSQSTPLEDEPKLNVITARARGGRYKLKEEEGEGEANNTNNNNNNNASTDTPKGEGEESAKEPEVPELPELSSEEKAKIFDSADFREFFDRASRVVDRALYVSESLDIMEDYKTEDKEESQAATREAILKATLFDERWSKHRSITDLAWSTKHPELVLASYSANEAGSHDPDGVVLLWNINNFYQKPEFIFNCQSPVMTAQFSKFHATMVVGGTYSGQIVLWDTRAKAMPVQRTPLSAVGHTHPVYSLSIVGSANAHNLVSISTDGRLCVWNLENLSHPSETLELSNKLNKPVTAPVAVTSLSFPDGEVNSFLVGSEEGAIFQGYRHGTTSGITDRYDGHFGPITATDFHPARGNIDFSHLFLSSSTDWSCKLWSSKHGSRSLYSFEDATDYVYDARWAPTHPAVFATVDGSGFLDVWNLNEDTEVPILKAKASPSSSSFSSSSSSSQPSQSSSSSSSNSSGNTSSLISSASSSNLSTGASGGMSNSASNRDLSNFSNTSSGSSNSNSNNNNNNYNSYARALNRLVWSADAKRIVTGDAAGYVYLYDVGDIAVPDVNEWARFEEVLQQLTGSTKGPRGNNNNSNNNYSSFSSSVLDDDSMPPTPRDSDDFST